MRARTRFLCLALMVLILSGCGTVTPSVTTLPEPTKPLSLSLPAFIAYPAPVTPTPTATEAGLQEAYPNMWASVTAEIRTRTVMPITIATPTATFTPSHVPLPTSIPNRMGLTIEENEIRGGLGTEPFSFQPAVGSQEAVLARHTPQHQDFTPFEGDIDSDGWEIRREAGGHAYKTKETVQMDAEATLEPGGFRKVKVEVARDGKIIFTTQAGYFTPLVTIRGFWTSGDHWTLEIAVVTNPPGGNSSDPGIIGKIYQDGELLNDRYGYDAMFDYQMLGGQPFYFYEKAGKIHLSYNQQDLPLVYDTVLNYGCCSRGVFNPGGGINWVRFFGRRDGIMYYTEIGTY